MVHKFSAPATHHTTSYTRVKCRASDSPVLKTKSNSEISLTSCNKCTLTQRLSRKLTVQLTNTSAQRWAQQRCRTHTSEAENTDQDAMHAADSQVCLLVWSKVVVHFPLQVDGQVRDAQDGTRQVHQAVGETGAFLQCTQRSPAFI